MTFQDAGSLDPRDPPVVDPYPETPDTIAHAKVASERERSAHIREHARQGAKEALYAICDAYPDGFRVLLQLDRISDVFPARDLKDAFNDILTERRRR